MLSTLGNRGLGRIVWLNETKICRIDCLGREQVWKHIRKKAKLSHVRRTIKHGDDSIMIQSCITICDVRLMVRVPKCLNQHLYKQILVEALLKTMDTCNRRSE
jgi:hypothetical protein